MGWREGLSQGFGAAAGLLGASIENDRKIEAEARAGDRQLDIATRLRAIDEAASVRAEERKRTGAAQDRATQTSEITGEVRRLQNERDAAAINKANGTNMTAEDADILRDKPEARKAYGLLDSDRKSYLEDRSNAAENKGYLDAARETRGALQNEIANSRNENNDVTTNRRLDNQQALNERESTRREKAGSDALSKAELQSTRLALSTVLKDIGTQEDKLQGKLADPMINDVQRKSYSDQIKALENDRISTRKQLLDLSGISASSPPPKYAEGTLLNGPGGQYIVKNGIPVQVGSAEKDVAKTAKPEPPQTTPQTAQPESVGLPSVKETPPQNKLQGSTYEDRRAELLQKLKDVDSDSELADLLVLKNRAIKSGKAAQANNYLAKYNELKKQKYGL